VGAWAKKNLHCQKDEALIRDAKPKNGKPNELIFDICCLEYAAEDNKPIVCASPSRGGGKGGLAEVGIGAAIALPLALGIGIPLLIEEEEVIKCHDKYTFVPGKQSICPSGKVYKNVLTQDECCLLCELSPGLYCSFIPAYTFCQVCTRTFFFVGNNPQATAFIPK